MYRNTDLGGHFPYVVKLWATVKELRGFTAYKYKLGIYRGDTNDIVFRTTFPHGVINAKAIHINEFRYNFYNKKCLLSISCFKYTDEFYCSNKHHIVLYDF